MPGTRSLTWLLFGVSLAMVGCAGQQSGYTLSDLLRGRRHEAVAGHDPFVPQQPTLAADAGPDSPTLASESGETDRRAGSAITPAESIAAIAASNARQAPDPTTMAELITEIKQLGIADPAAQQQLLDDLSATDIALWGPLLQQHRAVVQYRQQQAAAAATAVATDASVPDQVRTQIDPAIVSRLPNTVQMASAPANPSAGAPVQASAAVPLVGTQPAGVAQAVGYGQPAQLQPQQALYTTDQTAPPGAVQLLGATSAVAAVPSATVSTSPTDPAMGWHSQVAAAIESLESLRGQGPASAITQQEAYLRLLYLMAGRREDALRPIVGLPPAQQDFWAKELYGLSVFLDENRNTDVRQRAAEAAFHLSEARAKLGEIAPLVVRNMAFCTEVSSYGVYTTFERDEFEPGQQLLLYAEVENFATESTASGYRAALKSRYQIFNSQGQRVVEREFPVTEEQCRNLRRDFFIRYFLYLPTRVYDGERYTLRLTIEDTIGEKTGESTIDFTIKQP